MKNEHRLREEYADLLGGSTDADLLRFVGDLDAVAGMGAKPPGMTSSIQRALTERAGQQRVRRRRAPRILAEGWASGWFPRGLSGVAAPLLALVLAASVAYAAVTLLDRVFGDDRGTQQVILEDLGTELNRSRTVDGFTVTLGRVYADANRVLVGYTVEPPAGRGIAEADIFAPRLTDGRGGDLQEHGGRARYGEDATGVVRSYSTGEIGGRPRELELMLTADSISYFDEPGGAKRTVRAMRQVRLDEPLRFAFTVPMHPGRVAELHQTVETGGTKATLERAVVTPTETRVYVRGAGLLDASRVTLSVDGWSSTEAPGWNGVSWYTSDGVSYLGYSVPLYDKRGEWTLTIRAAPPAYSQGTGIAPVEGGPWTFRFVVP